MSDFGRRPTATLWASRRGLRRHGAKIKTANGLTGFRMRRFPHSKQQEPLLKDTEVRVLQSAAVALSADGSQPSIIIHQLTFGPLASFSEERRDAGVLNSCQIPSTRRPRRRRPGLLYLLPTASPMITGGIDSVDLAVVWRQGRTGKFVIISPLQRSRTPPPEYQRAASHFTSVAAIVVSQMGEKSAC